MGLAAMSLKMLLCLLLNAEAQNAGSAGSAIAALRGGAKPSHASTNNASATVRALQETIAVFPISNADEVMQAWAALGDPMDIMTSGLAALTSVLEMDNPTLTDVAQAAGSFGLELLSTANPLLGTVVTFFSGLMSGIFGDDESSTSMYQQVLQAAERYTDEQLIKERLRECCQVGYGINAALQTLRRGPLIEESASWYEERYIDIRQERGRVFGDCEADPDSDDCRTWQQQGGAVALDFALALATTEINLLLHIIASRNSDGSGSPGDAVSQRMKQLIAENGATYVRLLYAHYNEYKTYRLGLVESATWSHNAEYQGAVRYTWTKTGGLRDGFTDESYSDSCTGITAGTQTCSQTMYGYCMSWSAKSTTVGVCYSDGSGSSQTCGGTCTCCTEAMPCLRSQYAACTTQYQASLTQEMESRFKGKIDLLDKAVQRVQSQLTNGARRV